jgi:trehalose 6-phosphate phosphatase
MLPDRTAANQVGKDGRMRPDEVIAELRPRLDGALIATDFDGTLAPIVADPESSRPVAGAVEVLAALAERGAHIGVVTGRDAATVLRLSGLETVPGLVVEGLYGLEQWRDGELRTPETPEPMAELSRRLPELLATEHAADGVWIEDKRLSLVLHTRPAADPDAEHARLRAPAEDLARRLGLDVHPGRNVLEFRLPGYDKGGAVRRLVESTGPGAVLYAGDDVGDLPAFAAIEALRRAGTPAWGVAATSDEVPAELTGAADVTVDGPAGVVALLRALL